MVKVKSRVSSTSRLRRRLRLMPEAIREPIKTVMDKSGRELRDEIAAKMPKDTGATSEAAKYQVSNDGLGLTVGYGNAPGFKRIWKKTGFKVLFIEFGTKTQPARPIVRPAFKRLISRILDDIDRAVGEAIRKARG